MFLVYFLWFCTKTAKPAYIDSRKGFMFYSIVLSLKFTVRSQVLKEILVVEINCPNRAIIFSKDNINRDISRRFLAVFDEMGIVKGEIKRREK